MEAVRKLEPLRPEVSVSGAPRRVELQPPPAGQAVVRPRVGRHKGVLSPPVASAQQVVRRVER